MISSAWQLKNQFFTEAWSGICESAAGALEKNPAEGAAVGSAGPSGTGVG